MVQQLCRNATVLPLKEIWDALSFCLSEHCTKCTAGIRCRVLRTTNIYYVSTEKKYHETESQPALLGKA